MHGGCKWTELQCKEESNFKRLKLPFRMILAGGSGTGKSSYMSNFIRNLNQCVDRDQKFSSICIFYQILSPDLVILMNTVSGLELRQGIPTQEEINSLTIEQGNNTLWVIEDALSEIRNSKLTTEIMTRVSSHCGLSVCMTIQVLKIPFLGKRNNLFFFFLLRIYSHVEQKCAIFLSPPLIC